MVKTYNLEDLMKQHPRGTTHIEYSEYSFSYIKHDNKGFRVWLGIKHGGWSFKLNYQHPNFRKLIKITG